MIDIHCHILPELDDGAKNFAESLDMARQAVKEGIDTIIATPHHKKNFYENPRQKIIDKTADLNRLLAEEKIPLHILPGQEPHIYGEMAEREELAHILPLADTHYLFVELPSGHVPRYTEKLFFDLQLKEMVPVVVHPERNQEIVENPELLYKLVKNGALTQLTAGSICGKFGKNIRNFSMQLIEANLAHFVASDAHNIGNRGFHMAAALDTIESKFGYDLVYLFTENAELLADGKNVYKEIPERVKKKKFLGLF